MDIHDIYNAAVGFNQTEKDSAGRVISRPVRPVVLLLNGGFPTQQRITHLQQLIELLKISIVQVIWQYDNIALTITIHPQHVARTAIADIAVSQGSTTATLGTFAVTFREDFTVPQEVIEALKQKASVKH